MLIPLAAAAALLTLPAFAHITLKTPIAPAGAGYGAVPHGCGGGEVFRLTVFALEDAQGLRPMAKQGPSARTAPGQAIFENDVLPADDGNRSAPRLRTPDHPGGTLLPLVKQGCVGDRTANRADADAPRLRLAQAHADAPAEAAAGALRIANGWSRATARAGATGAGFVTIRNTSGQPDRLIGAASPVASTVELHTHLEENGVMRMRPVEGIEIPPHGTVTLAPGGLHIMLIGTKAPLRQGSAIPVTLRFERAGEVGITLIVRSAGATEPRSGNGHHSH